jgi:hypothetical protein
MPLCLDDITAETFSFPVLHTSHLLVHEMQSTSRILGFACSVAESGLLAPPPMHLGTSAAPLGPTPLVPRLSYNGR